MAAHVTCLPSHRMRRLIVHKRRRRGCQIYFPSCSIHLQNIVISMDRLQYESQWNNTASFTKQMQ